MKLFFYPQCEVKWGLQNEVSKEWPSLTELEKRMSMYEKDTKLCNQYLTMEIGKIKLKDSSIMRLENLNKVERLFNQEIGKFKQSRETLQSRYWKIKTKLRDCSIERLETKIERLFNREIGK